LFSALIIKLIYIKNRRQDFVGGFLCRDNLGRSLRSARMSLGE